MAVRDHLGNLGLHFWIWNMPSNCSTKTFSMALVELGVCDGARRSFVMIGSAGMGMPHPVGLGLPGGNRLFHKNVLTNLMFKVMM